jgi:hypothetical protein
MGMDRRTTGSCGASRRFTAGILAFALVLQGIAFTWAGARLAADPTGAADRAGFELCRHGNETAPGGAPASPGADSHCIFCLAGAACLDAPAAASQSRTITFAVSWSFRAWRLPAGTVNASARPRGPPLVA